MTPRQVDELLDLVAALLRSTEAIARHLGDDGDHGVGLRAVPGNGTTPESKAVPLHAAPRPRH
jgi:hypothetical protein